MTIHYITMTRRVDYHGGRPSRDEMKYLKAMRKDHHGRPDPYFTHDRDLARGFKSEKAAAAVLEVAREHYLICGQTLKWEVCRWPGEDKYFHNRLFGDDGIIYPAYAGLEDPNAWVKKHFPAKPEFMTPAYAMRGEK